MSEREFWGCEGCGRVGTSARDLLAQGCEGKPERLIPREAIEKEVEAALDDLDRMPASIYFRDEGIAASYRERLDAARGRLSALLSDGEMALWVDKAGDIARAALRPGVSEGATDSAGIASLPVERSAENPGHGPNQPDRPLADSDRCSDPFRGEHEPTNGRWIPARTDEASGSGAYVALVKGDSMTLPYPANLRAERDQALDLARELYEAAVEHLDKGRRPRIIAAVKRYEQEVGE